MQWCNCFCLLFFFVYFGGRQSDILSPKFALEWMSDFEKLQEALDTSGDESYMNSLNRSLALVLDEFYNALTAVGVSAASGDGMPALFKVWCAGSYVLTKHTSCTRW